MIRKPMIVSVIVLSLALHNSSVQADSVEFVSKLVTQTWNPNIGGNVIPYGLFVRGCAVYTNNDGCGAPGFGFEDNILNVSDTPFVLVASRHTDNFCHQRLFAEDWAEVTFLFQGRAAQPSGIRLSSVKDTPGGGSCPGYTDVSTFAYSAFGTFPKMPFFTANISSYDDTLYVSTDVGLLSVTFDPASSPPSLSPHTMSPDMDTSQSIGSFRWNDYVYEGGRGAVNSDIAFIKIRNPNTLAVVASRTDTLGSVGTFPGSVFRIIKNDGFTYTTGDTIENPVGALLFNATSGSPAQHDVALFDLDPQGIVKLRSGLLPTPPDLIAICVGLPPSTLIFSGLFLLENYLFVAGEYSPFYCCGDCPQGHLGIVVVYDISQPQNPVPIAWELTPNEIEGDGGSPLVHVSPVADGTFSIYTNWLDTPPSEGSVALWKFKFTPTNPIPFTPGDVNNDGNVNISDILKLIQYLFESSNFVPSPLGRGDVNGDGYVNYADLRTFLHRIFQGGDAPGDYCNECP